MPKFLKKRRTIKNKIKFCKVVKFATQRIEKS